VSGSSEIRAGEDVVGYVVRRAMECREAAMLLCPHDYQKRVGEWRDRIVRTADAWSCPIGDVVYTFAVDLAAVRPGDSVSVMWLFAAFAEEALAATDPASKQPGGGA
jgi:hypothetical protein